MDKYPEYGFSKIDGAIARLADDEIEDAKVKVKDLVNRRLTELERNVAMLLNITRKLRIIGGNNNGLG